MCFLVNRKIRSRIVLHLHNDYLNNQVSNAKKIIENCHTILTVSEFIRSRVLTIGLDYSNKVKILKNCTDTVLFDRNRYFDFRKWYRSNYSIERDDIVIMFSGRIHQTKGIKELLLAYEKLNCSNAKLLVIGSSWYGNNHVTKFSKEINDLSNNYKKNIIFTGYIPFEEVPKFHSEIGRASCRETV